MHAPRVALNLSERINDVIVFARSVASAIAISPDLPDPKPDLAPLVADVAALELEQAAVLTRARGVAEERNVRYAIMLSELARLKACVQAAADAAPENARALIESAGMSVKRIGARPQPELKVTQGRVSGVAHVVAKALARRGFHEWQVSTDQKSWQDMPSTVKATTDIVDLVPGTLYFFRHRPVTSEGPGEWSQVVSLLVT